MSQELLKDIGIEIDLLMREYIRKESFTGTRQENQVTDFLLDYIGAIGYFSVHPEHYGAFDIPQDPFQRKVVWALLQKGAGDTVVLLHHSDVVGIEDFKSLKDKAFSPEELRTELLTLSLPEEVLSDAQSGEYIFGRGTADMKGGGAIQLALLKRYAQAENFIGNVLIIIVPDEENLSAGMRSAAPLLKDLKIKYRLHYRLMINSEPHQRKQKDRGILYEGSVGKMMPFVYVRGYLTHSGHPFEGLNPIHILAEVMRKTQLNVNFSDFCQGEISPPPTWLYFRDQKAIYDVSTPLSAYGYFSVLTLKKDAEDILDILKNLCYEAFHTAIEHNQEAYLSFCRMSGKEYQPLQWQSRVLNWQELYMEATKSRGQAFVSEYEKTKKELKARMDQGKITMTQVNLRLIETLYENIDHLSPSILYGLIPPYYPAVSNFKLPNLCPEIINLTKVLSSFAQEHFHESYDSEKFFMGISDLSYSSLENPAMEEKAIRQAMPMEGEFYGIPFQEMAEISMPCMNIGPWGKDLHKLTERVNAEDLYVRTPALIDKAICSVLRIK